MGKSRFPASHSLAARLGGSFLFACLCLSTPLAAQQLVFPGAEGFGRFAEGGRGGDVYAVTNLNDAGPGSLREGLHSASGPRTIVFEVSGTITLESALTVGRSHITIAGQTAPGDGITLRDHPLHIAADHVVVRYLRSRLGDRAGKAEDAVSVLRGRHIMIDHCTASWSVDETLSAQGDDIDLLTIQWCLVSESLDNSVHHKGRHGMGGIIGAVRQTYHHNLFAHHATRNPKITWRRHCQVDFRNNVIFNWGRQSSYDAAYSQVNWVNNYYKAGPATQSHVSRRIFQIYKKEPVENWPNASLYIEGNVVEGNPMVSERNWSGGVDYSGGANEAENRASKPFGFPPLEYETDAAGAYRDVLMGAGASITRDAVDRRVIQEVRLGRATFGNGIIDRQDDVGAWPELSSLPPPVDHDGDGMPDYWEVKQGLAPKDPTDGKEDQDGDGYTNLEEYLNELAAPGFPPAMRF